MSALSERSSLGNSQRANTPYGQKTPRQRPMPRNASPDDTRASARKASLNALLGGNPTTPRAAPFSATIGPGSTRPTMPEGQIDIDVGDTVEVPGGMTGTVKFLGNVRGKKGIFAGIELSTEYADRGKNDGDVEGTRYFTTSVPGSGIFLPAQRAAKLGSPTFTADDFPSTPTTPAVSSFDLNKNLRASSQSPQTPSIPKFSQSARPGQRPNFGQSLAPGARAASPQIKAPKSRPSLPRPESPLRKQPSLPAPASGRGATPGAGFSQSLRGVRPPGLSPGPKASFSANKTPTPARSPSRTQSRNGDRREDYDNTPTNFSRTVTNGATRPKQVSSSGLRPSTNEESEANARLRRSLEERDRQLKEQATSLAEMESSLADLQTLVASSTKQRSPVTSRSTSNGEEMSGDAAQLRTLLREKNERIANLTGEFDAHRADFRSTIDTLEMASTETERVYEKRVDELLHELAELQDRDSDVESVAQQLKQLEELVQELEDGLEDARRGEAEARGEVEFLRGEVERGHSELRREREKAAKALKGAAGAVNNNAPATPTSASNIISREVFQRDDEIRGLKAIIHSLSSGPDAASPSPLNRSNSGAPAADGADSPNKKRASGHALHAAAQEEMSRMCVAIDGLNREKGELRGLIERKNFREEELERELAKLRRQSSQGNDATTPRAVPADSTAAGRNHSDSVASARTAIRPGTSGSGGGSAAPINARERGHAPMPLPLSGSASRPGTAHGNGSLTSPASATFEDASETPTPPIPGMGSTNEFISGHHPSYSNEHASTNANGGNVNGGITNGMGNGAGNGMSSRNSNGNNSGKIEGFMAQITGEGPAPGKASKRVDMQKWCALCERDGHESVDCPFEEEY